MSFLVDSSYKSLGTPSADIIVFLDGISMFFARRKPEEVPVGNLNQFLNLQFEKKLGQFGSRSQTIVDDLGKAVLRFGDACDTFEKLEAEPNIEGRYAVNINFIKTQKGRYVGSLKNILKAKPEDMPAVNTYETYANILASSDDTVKKILEANANFKTVLYCYSNHLWDFKSLFSEIERHTAALKSELDSKSDEFSKYAAVRSHISMLNRYCEELLALKKSAEVLKANPNTQEGVSRIDGTDAHRKLYDKMAELARLRKENTNLHSRITSLVLPLERASKKLDYLSAHKAKLHKFVEDPISTINNEAEYKEFNALVQELDKNVREGRIDLKNSDKVSEIVSLLLGSDFYSMVRSFRSNLKAELEAKTDIEALEKNLTAIKNEKTASEKCAQEMAGIEEKVVEAEKGKDAEKKAIEKLFEDDYGVLIVITN